MSKQIKKGIAPSVRDQVVAEISRIPGVTVTEKKGWLQVAGPHGVAGARMYLSTAKNAMKHVHLSGLGAHTEEPPVGMLEGEFPVHRPWEGCLPLEVPNGNVIAYLDTDRDDAPALLVAFARRLESIGVLPKKAPKARKQAA
ncbi:MAG TPA: hypothetical protein VEA41_09840 [Salinarimonas sp.]|nr:hypothetical protein [Salinarimonas sp.]